MQDVALITDAYAQAAPAAPQQPPAVFGPAPVPGSDQPTFLSSLINILPLILVCYLIIYLMVMKPQDVKSKSHKALIETLKRGDQVITAGGLVGKVVSSEKEFFIIEIASNVKVKVEQSYLVKRVGNEQKAEAA